MSQENSSAADEARQAAGGGPADRLLERLAERVGARASVQAVFGAPITNGDRTVVPVARVRWGFGGGGGSADGGSSGPASGSGGGGGVAADPIGYLEIAPGGIIFHSIREPYPSPAFLLVSAVSAAIVLRALASLIRR